MPIRKISPLSIPPARAIHVLAMLAIVSIVVSLTFLLEGLRKRELDEARSETVSLTRMLMEQTEQAFDSTDLALRSIQDRMQTSYGRQLTLNSLPVHLLLSTRVAGLRQVSLFFMVDADGRIVNSSRDYPVQRVSVLDRDYFTAFARDGKMDTFLGAPLRSPLTGGWTLHLARRIDDSAGKFRGVLVAAMNLENFEQNYSYMKLDFLRPIALYRDDGRLVASLPKRDGEIGYPALELQFGRLPLAEDAVRIVTHVAGDGSRRVFALGRVRGFPLLVSVTNDEVDALASWREAAVPIALGAILVIILIAAAASLLARKLRREEILAHALREADDRYLRTIDTVMDAIVAIDGSQRITLFNEAAERMFGIPAIDAVGTPLASLIPERLRDEYCERIQTFMGLDGSSRTLTPIGRGDRAAR